MSVAAKIAAINAMKLFVNIRRLLFLVVFVTLPAERVFAQIPGNVISRVYQIRVPAGTATSFILEGGDRQYIFTANHVVEGLGDHAKIELMSDGKWVALNVRILHSDNKCEDVAVLIPDQKEPLLKADPLPQTNNFFIGQETYFLGYPYGLAMQASNVHLTAALVKHAYISAVVRCSDLTPGAPEDKTVILLDGFNNFGFSGGPVVTRDLNDSNRAFKVIGIISGFRADNTPVSVNGQNAIGASVPTNTGIIVATGVDRAFALIEADKALNAQPKK
jgi:S1-C subfamily serine protease